MRTVFDNFAHSLKYNLSVGVETSASLDEFTRIEAGHEKTHRQISHGKIFNFEVMHHKTAIFSLSLFEYLLNFQENRKSKRTAFKFLQSDATKEKKLVGRPGMSKSVKVTPKR